MPVSELRHVTFVAGSSFPTEKQPDRGIFNLRSVLNLAAHVKVTVIHVRAWLPGRGICSRFTSHGLPVVSLALPYFGLAAARATFRSLATAGWPFVKDIIAESDIIHTAGASFNAGVGSLWSARSGVPHIAQATGSDLNADMIQLSYRRIVQPMQRHIHGAACNSDALRRTFNMVFPGVPNVRTIYRGVDLSAFRPDHPAALPPADPAPRYLYLGGFPAYKGTQFEANTKGGLTLLEAWKQADPEASLVIGGPESDAGSPLLSAWRSSLKHPERVILAGRVRPEQIAGLICSADAVLIPSLEDGLPNVGMEAMACGRPILGSRAGGIPELIADVETGWLLPPGDARAWRDALAASSTRIGALRRMGEAARERAATMFDSSRYADQLIDLYRAVREANWSKPRSA